MSNESPNKPAQHHALDFIKNMDPNGPGFVKPIEKAQTLEDLKPAPTDEKG